MSASDQGRSVNKKVIKKMEESGAWHACIDACRAYLNENAPDRYVQNVLAWALFQSGQYARALSEYQKIRRCHDAHVDYSVVKTCILKSFNDEEARSAAWRSFSTKYDIKFGKALELSIHGQDSCAREAFSRALEQASVEEGLSESHRAAIKRCYELLLSKAVPSFRNKELYKGSQVSKVIVSGMGWSGSGAVYDFLREFEGITPIKGESPYIEGVVSLKTIKECLYDDDRLNAELQRFFFYLLLGKGVWEKPGHFRLFSFSKERRIRLGLDEYFKRVLIWCELAACLRHSARPEKIEKFMVLADFTVDAFCIVDTIPRDQTALLDNVVHVGNVDCIEFLSNTTIICCFRDPRSNYVALLREARNFKSNVHEYIKQRTRSNERVKRALRLAHKACEGREDKKVLCVQFEDFVVNAEARSHLATLIGLDCEKSNHYKYFKPWESFRNVLLHHEYEDQNEIDLIKRELIECCRDIQIIPCNL